MPQIRIRAFPYPILACDVDDIPDTLIGWTDTNNNYDIHNLIYDIPYEGSKREGDHKTAPSEQPSTISEHNDEDDESSAKQDGNSEEPEESAAAAEIPKWPIYSIVKHYPRSFGKET